MGLLDGVRKLFADKYERDMIESLQAQETYAAHINSPTANLMSTPERREAMGALEDQGRRLWELTGRKDLIRCQTTLRAYRALKDRENDDQARSIAETIGDMYGGLHSDSSRYLLMCMDELRKHRDRRIAPFVKPLCRHTDQAVRAAAEALMRDLLQ